MYVIALSCLLCLVLDIIPLQAMVLMLSPFLGCYLVFFVTVCVDAAETQTIYFHQTRYHNLVLVNVKSLSILPKTIVGSFSFSGSTQMLSLPGVSYAIFPWY